MKDEQRNLLARHADMQMPFYMEEDFRQQLKAVLNIFSRPLLNNADRSFVQSFSDRFIKQNKTLSYYALQVQDVDAIRCLYLMHQYGAIRLKPRVIEALIQIVLYRQFDVKYHQLVDLLTSAKFYGEDNKFFHGRPPSAQYLQNNPEALKCFVDKCQLPEALASEIYVRLVFQNLLLPSDVDSLLIPFINRLYVHKQAGQNEIIPEHFINEIIDYLDPASCYTENHLQAFFTDSLGIDFDKKVLHKAKQSKDSKLDALIQYLNKRIQDLAFVEDESFSIKNLAPEILSSLRRLVFFQTAEYQQYIDNILNHLYQFYLNLRNNPEMEMMRAKDESIRSLSASLQGIQQQLQADEALAEEGKQQLIRACKNTTELLKKEKKQFKKMKNKSNRAFANQFKTEGTRIIEGLMHEVQKNNPGVRLAKIRSRKMVSKYLRRLDALARVLTLKDIPVTALTVIDGVLHIAINDSETEAKRKEDAVEVARRLRDFKLAIKEKEKGNAQSLNSFMEYIVINSRFPDKERLRSDIKKLAGTAWFKEILNRIDFSDEAILFDEQDKWVQYAVDLSVDMAQEKSLTFKESRLLQVSAPVIIYSGVMVNKMNFHAEQKLWRLFHGEPELYLGITILSCASCHVVLNDKNVVYSGSHNRFFPNVIIITEYEPRHYEDAIIDAAGEMATELSSSDPCSALSHSLLLSSSLEKEFDSSLSSDDEGPLDSDSAMPSNSGPGSYSGVDYRFFQDQESMPENADESLNKKRKRPEGDGIDVEGTFQDSSLV